jgi:GNAT superfamily N-acetyltransferase
MEPLELSRLIEANEAAAYRSFLGAAGPGDSANAGFGVVEVGSVLALVSPAVRKPGAFNRVLGLGLWEDATEALIDELSGVYERAGCGFAIEAGPYARPSAITDWLRARRIRRGTVSAVHYRHHSGPIVARPSEVRVVRASGRERDVAADLCSTIFRMPGAVRELIAALGDVPEWRHWLAYLGDTPIGAGLSFVSGRNAWVGWAATLPEYRGKGAKSAIDDARVADALASGCTLVTAETATGTPEQRDPSFKSYQRLGFNVAYERVTYLATRVGAAAAPGAG